MKRPSKLIVCSKDHRLDPEVVIKLVHEYEEYIEWLEKEKPDYISWHSVERIQELEKRINSFELLSCQSQNICLHYKPSEDKPKPYTCPCCGGTWVKGDGKIPKPHTCGECKFFKNREDMLAGDCWRWKEGRYSIFLYSTEKPDDLPCSKFEPRGESCTE